MSITYTKLDETTFKSPKNSHIRWIPMSYKYQIDGEAVVERLESDLLASRYEVEQELINKDTELLSEGFDFVKDGSTYTFSTSESAQGNWNSLMIIKDTLSYPYAVIDINEDALLVEDATELESVFLSGVSYKNGVVTARLSLKDQLNAALTLDELKAVAISNAAREKSDYT